MKIKIKIRAYRLNLCILILGITLLLLVSLATVTGSIDTESYCHSCFQSSLSCLSRNNHISPAVRVREIIFLDQQLEEGKLINLTIIIENKDEMSLSGFRLIIVLTEIKDARGEEPVSRTINKSLDAIPAISNVTKHISFTNEFGEYLLTACLAYGDIIVPKSSCSTQVHILSPPIGDVQTLVFALGGILAFMLLIILIPGIIDQFRFLSKKKPLKGKWRIIKGFLKKGKNDDINE